MSENEEVKNMSGGDGDSDIENTFTEEVEPKFKYARMRYDLHRILEKESVTCLAVHPKFVCMGCTWGAIHLLDHEGNDVLHNVNFQDSKSSEAAVSPNESKSSLPSGSQDTVRKKAGSGIQLHSVAVNQISIDSNGDFIATCSDDGKVTVHGLYSSENNHSISIGRLVKSIAIDPNYYKPGSGRRFVTGDERLVLHEKTLFSRMKSTVLCEAEGKVQNIKWKGQFIAWASDIGLRVYDINARCSLGILQWDSTSGRPQDYRCNLCWKNSYTLLVGWVDCVRICVIRRRIPQEITSRDPSDFIVEEISKFQTDFFIAGIAPLGNQLVILGYAKNLDANGKTQRPVLNVIEPHGDDYIEITTNNLSLRGYEDYKCNHYHLESLLEENKFFIVSPKDIAIASLRDTDDRVEWLMEHSKYEEAMELLRGPLGRSIKNYSLLKIGNAYVDHLIESKEYDRAAQLCQSILGKDKRLWEEAVLKFAAIQQSRAISKYLPRDNFRLDANIYEMVMYEFLKTDAKGFLSLVKEWPADLYRVPAVTNAVLQHLLTSNANLVELLEALAVLYGHDRKYDMALSMYLKLRHTGVFQMIDKHGLKGPVISNLIPELVELDPERAIAMLLEKDEFTKKFLFAPDTVVSKLNAKEVYLYMYLDALDKRDTKNAGRKYHGLLVRLYATYSYANLLPLLRRSDNYRISDALAICQERKFFPEMVYLLGRIGQTKEALHMITHDLNNIDQAIDFCKEQNDDELWEDLIAFSLKKPEFITTLLQRIGSYVDPRILIQRMDPNVPIPGLKNSLVKMMMDYKLQVSVQEGCKKILTSDYFHLHERLVRMQNRGILVDDEQFCGKCHESVIVNDQNGVSNIVVFCCKHVFHKVCLPSLGFEESYCNVCCSQRR